MEKQYEEIDELETRGLETNEEALAIVNQMKKYYPPLIEE